MGHVNGAQDSLTNAENTKRKTNKKISPIQIDT